MSIHQLELKKLERKYLLFYNGTCYEIGELLFLILQQLQMDRTWTEVHSFLIQEKNITLSVQTINEMVDEKLQPIFSKKASKPSSYIYGQVSLLKGVMLRRFTTFFQVLFHQKIFKGVLAFSVLMTITYFTLTYHSLESQFTMHSMQHWGITFFVTYLLSVGMMLFHELGHATASAHFKINSNKIGFGFYLVFPVFFTDVSKIWLLNTKERMIVNIAGIYFQLLINNILIITSFFFSNTNIIHSVTQLMLFSNSIIILNCLNPFLRNDGYWLYSDFFDIPNLMEVSLHTPVDFLKKYLHSSKRAYKNTLLQEFKPTILIYGLINYVVLGFVGYLIITTLLHYSGLIFSLINDDESVNSFINNNSFFDLVKIFFSYIITVLYVFKALKYFYRVSKNSFFKFDLSYTPST